MALAKLERQLDALLDDVTRMRHYKGFAADLKPLFERELERLNDAIAKAGGRPKKINL